MRKRREVLPFRSTLGSPGSTRVGNRIGWLTPYEVEILRSEVRSAGSGAQLDLFVPAAASEEGLAWVRSEFEPLRRAGIEVVLKRDAAWDYREAEPASRGRVRRA